MEKDCDEIDFRKVRQGIKVNHIPGQWIIGRKDHFTREYNKQKKTNRALNFYPRTFVLPEDSDELKKFMSQEKPVLLKPTNLFSGLGIKITDKLGKNNDIHIMMKNLNLNSYFFFR